MASLIPEKLWFFELRGRHNGKCRPSAFEHEKYRVDWVAREVSLLSLSYPISKLCNDDLSLSVFLHLFLLPAAIPVGGVWRRASKRLAPPSASWVSAPSGQAGNWFILAA